MAVYTSEAHNLIKAMGKAGITFPATKAELLEKFGDMTIKVDFDKEAKIPDTVKEMVPEDYSCACAFRNAYISAQMQALKKELKF